jgi:HlyD family secretion protein
VCSQKKSFGYVTGKWSRIDEMPRIAKIAILGLILLIGPLIWLTKSHEPALIASKEIGTSPVVLAARGRVEGRDESIPVGASSDGTVKEVLVRDGQQVSKGDLLAVINCDDISAGIDLAKAQAESARQTRVRILRGHRDEERKAAFQAAEAAKAVWTQAQEHFRRFDALYQHGEISRDAFEQAKRESEVAQANYEKAVQEQNLVNAGPLPEEVSRADAEVAAAERNINVATEKLEKCRVRAPISGTILKVMGKVGESYSTLLPHPLFLLADDSVRRVRAEVDERDIGKVKLGQAARITADGFPGQKFSGRVVSISKAMKPKSVLSDDPSQKVDRDVLDVTVEIDASKEVLPLGLRVTVQMTSEIAQLPAGQSSESHSPAPTIPQPKILQAPGAGVSVGLSGIVLQVAAMKDRRNADALASALQNKGFQAFVLARSGDRFCRVDMGPYPDPESARTVVSELKAAGFGTAVERHYPGPRR